MTEEEELHQECRQRQDDEIVALQSIYPANGNGAGDAQFTVVSDGLVQLHLPIILPQPTVVVIDSHLTASTKSSLKADASVFDPNRANGRPRPTKQTQAVDRGKHSTNHTKAGCQLENAHANRSKTTVLPSLTHLSPLTLRIRLPRTYPAKDPPYIDDLKAVWLSSRDTDAARWIERQLCAQYEDGMETLWTWATWLSEGLWKDASSPFALQTDTKLQLRFDEQLTTGQQPLLPSQLLAHSRLCTRTAFDSSSFDCGICLETKKGKTCTKLVGCGHVFCSDCLTSYLSMLVDEGFHRQARRCPDPECVKLWGEKEKLGEVDQNGDVAGVGLVTQSELEAVLTAAQLQRLDSLTVKAKMEADPSVSYCPREGCQAAVVRSSSDEGSGHWERFRECHKCSFAFCAWCSRSWHGPTSCPVSFQAGLIQQYLALEPDSPAHLQMQKKFGKKTLDTLVQNYLDEQETKQWLQDYTTPCPNCGISIEKSYGCNHMTCKSCLTHYCYLCGKTISGTNPYMHFNTPGYDCYNRLFDGLLGAQNPQGAFPAGPDGINAENLIPWEELV